MKRVILFIVTMFLLAGCGAAEDYEVKPDFSFDLPEGYAISNITDTQCDILQGETKIGGIVFTALKPKDIKDTGDKEFNIYLNSYGPLPLICEYISMFWESHISVTMKITDPDTGKIANSQHYVFAKDKAVYDLWLDTDLLNDDARNEIIKSAGIS